MRKHRGPPIIDITGQVFNDLTALKRVGLQRKYATWLCRCSCGQEIVVRNDRLRHGFKKSCGIGGHGYRHLPPDVSSLMRKYPSEVNSWRKMQDRCYKVRHHKYPIYGGRGITVCDRWRASFLDFLQDLGPKPAAAYSIERIDVNGNYESDNCKWATRAEQARNMRRSVFVMHEGKKMLLMDVADSLGLNRQNLYGRLKNGWTLEEALSVPVNKHKKKLLTTALQKTTNAK